MNTHQALTALKSVDAALSGLLTPRVTHGCQTNARRSGGGLGSAPPASNLRKPILPEGAQYPNGDSSQTPLGELIQHGTDPDWVRREIAKAEARDAKELGL